MLQQILVPALLLSLSSTISALAIPESSNLVPRTLTIGLPASGLPAPSTILPAVSLKYIGLGLGTQNYTCESTPESTTASPVSVGAVATLYNAGTWLQNHQDLIPYLPCLTLGVEQVSSVDPATITGLSVLGNHFFTEGGSPEFDLTGVSARLVAKKLNSVSPPAGACPGPDNAGAVNWLELGDNGASLSFGEISYVYRVETAGGNPPATCSGQTGLFTVPYSAEYWFYG